MTKEEESAMLQQIWNEIRYVRTKLDSHVKSNDADFSEMKKDITTVKTEITGHKTKLGIMFSGIGMVMLGLIAWVVSHTGGVK